MKTIGFFLPSTMCESTAPMPLSPVSQASVIGKLGSSGIITLSLAISSFKPINALSNRVVTVKVQQPAPKIWRSTKECR